MNMEIKYGVGVKAGRFFVNKLTVKDGEYSVERLAEYGSLAEANAKLAALGQCSVKEIV